MAESADGSVSVLLARLEERTAMHTDQIEQMRSQWADLTDKQELITQRLTTLSTQMVHIDGQCTALNSSVSWIVRLVLGLIVTALLMLVLGGVGGHVVVK